MVIKSETTVLGFGCSFESMQKLGFFQEQTDLYKGILLESEGVNSTVVTNTKVNITSTNVSTSSTKIRQQGPK